MSNIHILYTDNDTVLEVDSLRNDVTGDFMNGADVSVTLLDSTGSQVAGDTWPKSLIYVVGSRGVYRVTLGYALSLTANGRYTAQIVADAGPGLRASWNMDCVARARN